MKKLVSAIFLFLLLAAVVCTAGAGRGFGEHRWLNALHLGTSIMNIHPCGPSVKKKIKKRLE